MKIHGGVLQHRVPKTFRILLSPIPPLLSQVVWGLLAVFYNLGDGDYNITLPHLRLNDGEWHQVELDRFGRELTLRLDGGGGQQEVTAAPGQSQEILVDPTVVMLGNSFPSGHNRSFLGRWGFYTPGEGTGKNKLEKNIFTRRIY